MNIRTVSLDKLGAAEGSACLVVPIASTSAAQPFDSFIQPMLSRLTESGVWTAKPGSWFCYPTGVGPYAAVGFIAVDNTQGPEGAERLRRAGGSATADLAKFRIDTLVIDAGTPWAIDAFLEGVLLGQYHFDLHKQLPPESVPVVVENVTLVTENAADNAIAKACRTAAIICDNANWARDLANEAPNRLTTSQLACEAKTMCDHNGLAFECLDEGQMAELGLNALLSVAKGSRDPAKLVFATYHYGDHVPTVALVGKGITFDTGGVSIKPSDHMHEMKFDMCGAAAVLGAMRTVASIKPALNVIGVVPLAENAVGSRAMKPGDIVKAYNGKTIEIHNTDAEGRLILCDALAYVNTIFKPDMIIDLATLTGAVLVALGHHAAGMMTTCDSLTASLSAAAEATGERLWPFPLWDDYREMIKGTHADLCNIGPARQAGTIMGGVFLREFVGDTPWAHIDIAGTAWGVDKVPYWNGKHATGYGVRLLSRWILDQSQSHIDDEIPPQMVLRNG